MHQKESLYDIHKTSKIFVLLLIAFSCALLISCTAEPESSDYINDYAYDNDENEVSDLRATGRKF